MEYAMEPSSQSLVEQRKRNFALAAAFQPLDIVFDDEGWPFGRIGTDEEIPILSQDFELRIIQPGSVKHNKNLAPHIGKMMLPGLDAETSYDSMLLMPITIVWEGFRNFAPYVDGQTDEALLCYSCNGFTPSPKVTSPLNNVCTQLVVDEGGRPYRKIVCPYAIWEKGKKPVCRSIIALAFLALLVDGLRIPVRLQLHGTGMGAWNQLQREYKRTKNVAKLKRKSISDYVIRLTLENNGTYSSPRFTMIEAEEKLGKVSRYLPLIGRYMEHLYSRKTSETETVPPPSDAESSSSDDTVRPEAEEITL